MTSDDSIYRLVVDQTTANGQRFHLTRTLTHPYIVMSNILHALGYGL